MSRQRKDSSPGRERRELLAVTFDVTHTLIHSPCLAEIYGRVLRRHGIAVRVAQLRREIPWVWKEFACLADPRRDRFNDHPDGARGWWARFLDRLCQRLEVAPASRFAAAELFASFRRAEAWEVYPDVVPTLSLLRRLGLRLGVVSNWDHRLPELLANLGLARYFDAVVHSSACGCEKPHPRIFQMCLEALAVAPARALHVGDGAIEDVEGALALGMRAIRIDRQEPRGHLGALIAPFLGSPAVGSSSAERHWALGSSLDASRRGR